MLPCHDRHVACCGVLFVTDARSGALHHIVAALAGDPPLPGPDRAIGSRRAAVRPRWTRAGRSFVQTAREIPRAGRRPRLGAAGASVRNRSADPVLAGCCTGPTIARTRRSRARSSWHDAGSSSPRPSGSTPRSSSSSSRPNSPRSTSSTARPKTTRSASTPSLSAMPARRSTGAAICACATCRRSASKFPTRYSMARPRGSAPRRAPGYGGSAVASCASCSFASSTRPRHPRSSRRPR
jgi:hypothetical protein